jgi:hypothetical protein
MKCYIKNTKNWRKTRVRPCPYFAATGTHPLLPFDIVEANYLVPPPESLLSTTDLIASRAVALQKRQEDLARLKARVHEARTRAALRFERKYSATMRDFNFKREDLVLV